MSFLRDATAEESQLVDDQLRTRRRELGRTVAEDGNLKMLGGLITVEVFIGAPASDGVKLRCPSLVSTTTSNDF